MFSSCLGRRRPENGLDTITGLNVRVDRQVVAELASGCCCGSSSRAAIWRPPVVAPAATFSDWLVE